MSLSMHIQSCLKASLVALSILSTVTWLPQMYSTLSTFFRVFLPSVASTVVAPKCLFIFSNIIVVFLVSESKLSRSGSEPLKAGDDNGDLVAAGGDMLQRKEDEVVMEAVAPIVEESKQEDNVVIDQEEDTAAVYEAVGQLDQQDEEDDMVFSGVDEIRGEVVEEKGSVELMPEEEMGGVEEQREEEQEQELEERDLPPVDELNRRVEDFIARFNMERQLEARMLVSCC